MDKSRRPIQPPSRRRHLPARPLTPCVLMSDVTPDGFAEMNLEVNGRRLWTWLLCPGLTADDWALIMRDVVSRVARRC